HRLVTRFHYDTQHRLSQVTLPNLSTVRYRYDAFGRRISKDIGGYLTTFIWQANRLIAETDDFSHYRSYLYEPGTYRPLAQLEGEGNLAQVYYYHLDHLGTPQEMTAANGERVWSVQYKAYGHVKRTLIEKVDTNLRFQGQYYDGETGLHYNRHRYYHPGTGHFLTPDPIKLAGGLNHYQYVPNPVNWVDPLGLKTGKAVPDGCPKYSDKQKAIIDELRAKYPNAEPRLPDAQGNINEKHNAGERTPNFKNWHDDGGVVLYDAKTDQYIYATDMKTSTYGQKTVDVVYSPAADGNHYPDFSPYSYDQAELPNGVAVPKDRNVDYAEFYRVLDQQHGEAGYSERVYGVKRNRDGTYPGKNPQVTGSDGNTIYTPHHHENAKLMLMVDRSIHNKFKHKGGVSNANK
ncbi:RHS repeat-associated core domain-containing protein, partial [Pokkaliibacter plantistimulans]